MNRSKIIDWNNQRGFGFVNVDGKRIFVHATAIRPRLSRGADLNGVEIVIQKTEEMEKGLSAVSALTVAYENPKRGIEDPAAMWGEHNLSSLIAEVNTKVLAEAGVLGELPKVEFQVRDVIVSYKDFETDEPLDGMRRTITTTHKWVTVHGGIELTIWSPFLGKLSQYVSSSPAEGIVLEIRMDKGLDRSGIEDYIRWKIGQATVEWRLKDIGQFGQKLFSHIMAQIPSFSKEKDLWIIDGEKVGYSYAAKLPYGLAVVEVEPEEKPRDGRDRIVKSHVVMVVKKDVAEKLKLPGEPLAEAVVLWKNPPIEVLPLTEQAEKLLAKLRAIATAGTFSCFPKEVREKIEWQIQMSSYAQPFETVDPKNVREWCFNAECALEDLTKAEQQASVLAERQKSGEILTGFTAWHRRGGMTRNGDGWVIRPDGSLRERDSDDVRRHKSDGTYRWEIIEPEELAIRWQCHHRGNVAINSIFEVVKLPKNGCSKEQLETVVRIEQEIEAPKNAFGLGEKIKEVRKEEISDPVANLLQGGKIKLGL